MSSKLRVVGEREVDSVASLIEPQQSVGEEERTVSEEELTQAENDLRSQIQSFVKRIEATYWDLARGLYDVYDGVPGGYRALVKGQGSRAERKELFRKWGYNSFGKYCELEVGIRQRTAENLRYAYYWFAIKLNLPDETLCLLQSIGRSKVYQLAGNVTEDNVTLWIDKAKELTHDELKKSIKQAKIAAAGRNDDGEEVDQSGSLFEGPGEKEELPKPEEMHTLHTSLYEGQWNTYQAALKRAKALSGSEKIGHNVELICQDFLVNNDFGKGEVEDRTAFLVKIEKMMGVHLIAIEPSSGRPFFGYELMEGVLREMRSADDEG